MTKPSFIYLLILTFCLFRAAPTAYEGSQARGRIGAVKLLACTTATAMQDPTCVCDLHHSSRQHKILNPLSKARDRTCVLMDTSQIHFHWATSETPLKVYSFFLATPPACGSSQARDQTYATAATPTTGVTMPDH